MLLHAHKYEIQNNCWGDVSGVCGYMWLGWVPSGDFGIHRSVLGRPSILIGNHVLPVGCIISQIWKVAQGKILESEPAGWLNKVELVGAA